MSIKEGKSQHKHGCLSFFDFVHESRGMFCKPGFEKAFHNKDLNKLFLILFKKKRSSLIFIFLHVN